MPYYLTPNIHELRNFMNACRQLRHLLNIFAIGYQCLLDLLGSPDMRSCASSNRGRVSFGMPKCDLGVKPGTQSFLPWKRYSGNPLQDQALPRRLVY